MSSYTTPTDARTATSVTTTIIDGVVVRTASFVDSDGAMRTVTIPVVDPGREDQNGNDLADIPLLLAATGANALSAHLPTGYGLDVTGSTEALSASVGLLRMIQAIQAHSSPADHAALIAGATTLFQNAPLARYVQAIVPLLAADPALAPAAPLVLDGIGNANTARSVVMIDTRAQGDTVHIDLRGIPAAVIAGGGRFEHLEGRVQILADSTAQTIVLAGGGDVVDAGGGDDRIILGTAATFIPPASISLIDGGDGLDVAEFSGARASYSLRVERDALMPGTYLAAYPTRNIDASTFMSSIETLQFADTTADTSTQGSVLRLMEGLLDRTPDAAGVDFWVRQTSKGATLEQVAQAIMTSAELAGEVPEGDAAFVAWAYARVLGREADGSGLAYWTSVVADGSVTRASVALALAESGEKLAQEAAAGVDVAASEIGVIARMYAALYHRSPDLGGLNYWIGQAKSGAALADIADAFIGAGESPAGQDDATFIAHLYQTALARQASPDELADWRDMLASGQADRGDMLLALADSAEMAALVGVGF
ncbi:DUF4214 domain-containing protein [Massilia aurea]|uniref:DUF4214 domain-containing protein n=1 Tax=Massilia aurea TaxID=373040 RepID=UPI003461BD8A